MSEEFIKPNIVDEEIILDPNRIIMSKTDKFGIFEFANDYFIEVSGYEEYELMGKSMYCVQHPDMPEIIFKHLWEKLLAKNETNIIVKNLTKSGKYYWSLTSFTYKVDENDEISAIYSKRVAASKESIAFFSKLYKTLKKIEDNKGIEAAEKYAEGFLEEKQTDFNGLVNSFYKKTTATNTKTDPPKTITKQSEDKPNIIQELQEKAKNTNEKDVVLPKQKKPKKGLFQKLFGKTEEELEEERRRKKEGN